MSSVLVHHDLIMAPLGSGSRGNATYVGTPSAGILIDCGLSTKQIWARMDALGLGKAHIKAVFLTHEHKDHVGACRVFCNRHTKAFGTKLPFYCSQGTAMGLDRRCRPALVNNIETGHVVPVRLNQHASLHIEAFVVPHDTRAPVGFSVASEHAQAVVITDLGRSTRLIETQLHRADLAIVEFNHDTEMLLDGPYPWQLKQRVKGYHGHLSNAQAATLVANARPTNLKHLFCGHLSQDNNDPTLVHKAVSEALWTIGSKAQAHIAQQDAPGPIVVAPHFEPVAQVTTSSPPQWASGSKGEAATSPARDQKQPRTPSIQLSLFA